MSTLSDLVSGARVPSITTGRLTAAEREAAMDAITAATASVRAGESRAKFYSAILGALIGQAGGLVDAALAARAAKAAQKAAEAELARAQMEAEGEGEEG